MQGHMFEDVGREERVKISEAVRLKRVFIVIVVVINQLLLLSLLLLLLFIFNCMGIFCVRPRYRVHASHISLPYAHASRPHIPRFPASPFLSHI